MSIHVCLYTPGLAVKSPAEMPKWQRLATDFSAVSFLRFTPCRWLLSGCIRSTSVADDALHRLKVQCPPLELLQRLDYLRIHILCPGLDAATGRRL